MREQEVESRVARFLELKERDPGLDPEVFVRECGGSESLRAALRATLAAEAQLQAAGSNSNRPAEIGPYKIVRTLGSGGMGAVYEVEAGGVRLALKQLHPFLADEHTRARFKREAELLGRISHPGIVAVRGTHGDDVILMELIDGVPLLEAARAWDLDRKLQAVIEVCEAVHAAHRLGLLHRDLKPQNVLVRRDGRCVLVDFGLGNAEDAVTITSTGELLGTPRTMAPEQVRGEPADERTDVWGLGHVLYELSVGRPAILAKSRSATLLAVLNGAIARPRSVRPELPRDLERVLRCALALDPRHRPPGADALRDDLARLRAGAPVRARPPAAWNRALVAIRSSPSRRNRLIALLVLAVAAAAGGARMWTDVQASRTRALVARARSLLEAGELVQGVSLALAAARPGRGDAGLSPPELAQALQRAKDVQALRAILLGHTVDGPDRTNAMFALAVSHDGEHQLRLAADRYTAVLAEAPRHPWALLYLGHLRAGADRVRCESCRAAFQADPGLLDRDEALRLFSAAVEADAGRQADLLRMAVYLAREHELTHGLLETIDGLLAQVADGAARARLQDARAGLAR